MPKNTEALKLPDPLLVRLYREGHIDSIKRVSIDKTRNIEIQLAGQAEPMRFLFIQDIGWIPDPAAEAGA